MAHLAVRPQITYSGQPIGGPMAQRKPAVDTRTQRQKFLDAARAAGADESEEAFDRALRKVAKSPPLKAKKAARKPKG